MKTTIAASALMLGLAAPASAAETPSNSAVLSGGPIYDLNATATLCSFTNMGTQSITPLKQEIFVDGASATVAPQCDNNTPVAPNGACYLYTYSVGALHTCKLTFGSSAAKVRATLQSLDPNLNPRSSAELRQ